MSWWSDFTGETPIISLPRRSLPEFIVRCFGTLSRSWSDSTERLGSYFVINWNQEKLMKSEKGGTVERS